MSSIDLNNIRITDAALDAVPNERLQECFAKHLSLRMPGWEKTSGFPIDPENPDKGALCIITVADSSESLIGLADEILPGLAQHVDERPLTTAERLAAGEAVGAKQVKQLTEDRELDRD